MRVTGGLALAVAKPLIQEKLAIDDPVFEKAKFFKGAIWVLYKQVESMKGDFMLPDFRNGDTLLVVITEETAKIGN
jgi:hypothetical protein